VSRRHRLANNNNNNNNNNNKNPLKAASSEAIKQLVDTPPCLTICASSQDKAKLKVRKRSEPYEPEVVSNMVRYARKKIAEFRAVKNQKNILPVAPGRTLL